MAKAGGMQSRPSALNKGFVREREAYRARALFAEHGYAGALLFARSNQQRAEQEGDLAAADMWDRIIGIICGE